MGMGEGGGRRLQRGEVAKSLSIVRRVCDIQPALPNQCGSAPLKQREQGGNKERRNLPAGFISQPRSARILALFSGGRPCLLSLFAHNKNESL